MWAAIKHGLGNLLNLQGRDARQAFWYYILFLYLVSMAIGLVVSVPMTIQGVMVSLQHGMANAGNSDAAAQAATQAAMATSMGNYMHVMAWMTFASTALLLIGVAASFVRRLHDSGLSGCWALLPLGLQAVSLALIPYQFGMMQDMMVAQATDPLTGPKKYEGLIGLGALAGWGAVILVIVLGVRKSTPGPNRYGESAFNA